MATPEKVKNIFKNAAKRAGKTPSEVNGWTNKYFKNETTQPLSHAVEDAYIQMLHNEITELRARPSLEYLAERREHLSINLEAASGHIGSDKWFLQGRFHEINHIFNTLKHQPHKCTR